MSNSHGFIQLGGPKNASALVDGNVSTPHADSHHPHSSAHLKKHAAGAGSGELLISEDDEHSAVHAAVIKESHKQQQGGKAPEAKQKRQQGAAAGAASSTEGGAQTNPSHHPLDGHEPQGRRQVLYLRAQAAGHAAGSACAA